MGIRELILHTRDVKLLAEFYEQVLGLPVEEPSLGKLSVRCGSSRLIFRSSEKEAYYHFTFNIPPGQIEDALAWLRDRDLDVLHEGENPITEFPNWNARSLYFLDPAGNVLEFIARHDLTLPAIRPFSPRTAVHCISEIGLPVQAVAEAAAQLTAHTNIPSYWGSGSAFRALGDPEGLLILVDQSEKTWYPTAIPARAFPLELETETGLRIQWTEAAGLVL